MTEIIRNRAGIDKRIYDSVRVLSQLDPDRAGIKNGQGWNGSDGTWGHAIAEKPFDAWTLKMGQMAYKMIRKYQGQLRSAGIDYGEIEDPNKIEAQPATPRQPEKARITLEDGALIYRSPRDHAATALVRDLPARRWTGKDGTPPFVWRIALDALNISGLREIYALGTVDFDASAVAALKALSAPQTRRTPVEAADSIQPRAEAPAPSTPRQEAQQGMVRVAYLIDPDSNQQTFKLKWIPSGVIMHGHQFRTAREAQTVADQINARVRMDRVELS